MNRAIEALLRLLRRASRRLDRYPRLAAVLHALRRHWLEAIAVVGLVALVIGVDPARLAQVFRHIRWQVALLMVPVTFVMYVTRGLAWWVTLRRIGERVGVLRCLAIEFAGQVMVFMPMGDLARVAMAHRADPQGAGKGQLAGTIAFQELLYMTLIGFGVLPRVGSHPDVAVLVIVMTISHLAIFTILLWKPAYRWAVRTVERIRVLRRFDRQLRELGPTFEDLFAWRTFVPVILLNAVSAMLTFLLFFMALRALGQDQVTIVAAAFVLGLSYIISALSFLPGGLGAFEGLLTLLMVANGIPAAAGAAAGLLYRGYNDGLMALVGAVTGVFVRRAPPVSRRQRRRSAAA